ncbi:hypothetical protein [Streptomyces sp. AS02]|uniref:helix-turn-helix transcriptional regulator n=1 Tax=Streptomyces sp. AS02 TaxID=2938946 RepID=UPI002020ADE3|nr:hypothetical protein [Streptomyces sp. AS02]MCL8016941.1 hypothetical protein [Streptomyces sp. AS02]
MDPITAAYQAWTEHRFYRYRGCAPDPDNPRGVIAGPGLSLDTWHGPDVDGGESAVVRKAREDAAIEACLNCPVMVQCDAYANSVTPEGKLVEPVGIRAGRTALERHRALIKSRQEIPARPEPAPVEQLQTEQKLAVLRALAAHLVVEDVASAAGLDVRTAKWQLARITTQLGLEKAASRAEVLEAAVARGLLGADEVAVQAPAVAVAVPGGRRGGRGRRVPVAPGQLSFFDSAPVMGAAA